MLFGNTGFSLGSLLPVPSVPGTIRKVDDLKGLHATSASFYFFPFGKKYLQGSNTVEESNSP